MRRPDFERNMGRILRKEKGERVTLFELFLNRPLYEMLAGEKQKEEGPLGRLRLEVKSMTAAGYDYAPCYGSTLTFPKKAREYGKTVSMNGQAMITDWESFEKYPWPDADAYDYSLMEKIRPDLPEGMKLMVYGPGGVIENVIDIVGYDNLCIMIYEEPELAKEIFDRVGSTLVKYYENSVGADTVGFLCSNDDWGFNTQTFLSPDDMRKYVFPWHKKIVEVAHRNGRPCILHSCGYFGEIIDDVIDDMGYDGRHSYEDNIMPVEKAYEKYSDRIVIMGGIDVNMLTASRPDEIYARARALIEQTKDRGNYLLGSGNSIPEYIPPENYLAMIRAAWDSD